ncbi:MAG: esterase-like activity of phytase family protein [Niabella sp.]
MNRQIFFFFLIIALFSLWSCAPKITSNTGVVKPKLTFLDVYVIPHNLQYNGTIIGGLSGIDYDTQTGAYYLISDERSATSSARFYTANVNIVNNKITGVDFTAVNTLKQPDGNTFPSLKDDPVRAADPESIRYNPVKKCLVWSSEGDKANRNGVDVFNDPFVYEMDLQGNFIDSFLIPENMRMKTGEAGPRTNGVFEGMSFDNEYKNLYVSTEEPLFEDGPRADVDYSGAPVRITQYDVVTKKPVAQYAYNLDAVAHKPLVPNSFRVNGVPEILWFDKNRFLVMERSFSTGYPIVTIKIFLVDITNATNILNTKRLYQNNNYQTVKKELLINLDTLNRFIDNIEGISFGPVLPNGKRSLILVADNNFKQIEKSQVLLFELTE